ncbi:MAG: phosphate acetyltransferase [Paracoccus sp. (in: a-proteobacteria)]|nr:phosphate acetyltransferase [Paracoccus sp. (in: a-proteobacteria)]
MKPLEHIFHAAAAAQRRIILPEGDDPRIRDAAAEITARGLARVELLTADPLDGVRCTDPRHAADLDELAAAYHRLRAHKGVTPEAAREAMMQPIPQAAMRVRMGLADGTVGGAVATTADTVRAALQIIGRAPGAQIVSSFFLMLSCRSDAPIKGGMIFADCGLVVQPDAAELADIAIASAASCRSMLRQEPRVALLSFSTAGSGSHESITRIREALDIIRDRAPTLEADGELQFDAAFDDVIRARKAPGSRLSGRPNVFIFPDLASGNIGYKIAQRLAGIEAIGPVLQGLARPANDLSRGCSVADIVAAVAVTSVQAGQDPVA